ncbi:AAA family ATPase [Candidatus Woesearchaeota archaeon]|jgi:archaellum biogenesis ATPase FlaH|nr:AAA family ATPase [Candidatus Woesearchaeota archaeon]
MKIETTILKNLLQNEEYARKVLPFLNDEYFTENSDKIVFNQINNFILKYNSLPNKEALTIELSDAKITEEDFKDSANLVTAISEDIQEFADLTWLLDSTEKFCQDKAIYNAVVESISILDNPKSITDKGAIPDILSDALSVSFDPHVGHDYIGDSAERFDYYHRVEERIPFDLDYFNRITKGGLPQKTLNICLAGTGVGKSLFMCHVAASCLSQNQNVLYITLEMAEEKIAERIDANLLDVSIDDLHELPKDLYDSKMANLEKTTKGKLIIKEYPTASANVNHFRALLNELNLKRSFVPDIIFVDYLNICTSSRIKSGSNVNSYTLIKSIAEELRGLAVENKLPIVSATQTTRAGYCLDLESKIITKTGIKSLKDIQIGDKVLSSDKQYNSVKTIFPIKRKKMYKITTESGKEIVCSEEHLFPTKDGIEKNVQNSLSINDELFVL